VNLFDKYKELEELDDKVNKLVRLKKQAENKSERDRIDREIDCALGRLLELKHKLDRVKVFSPM
jgi:hypothetical protein